MRLKPARERNGAGIPAGDRAADGDEARVGPVRCCQPRFPSQEAAAAKRSMRGGCLYAAMVVAQLGGVAAAAGLAVEEVLAPANPGPQRVIAN